MMAASVASSRGLSSSDMAVFVGVELSYTSVGFVSCRESGVKCVFIYPLAGAGAVVGMWGCPLFTLK